ncbi:MAG: M36 family metallopeptidase [Acidobacteria bacterium]|nr:M36 family metallopeptidase [Acidobacteriota bacterium]
MSAQEGFFRSAKTVSYSPESDDTSSRLLQRGVPALEAAAAWSEMKRQALGEVEAFWRQEDGGAEALFGLIAPASRYGRQPEAIARSFFSDHKDLFKINGDVQDLALTQQVDSPAGVHVYFRQTLKGLPVFGTETALHINRYGIINGATSDYRADLGLAIVEPALSGSQADELLCSELSAQPAALETIFRRNELGAFVVNGIARLAWRVRIATYEPTGTWETYYDAISGQRLAPIVDRNCYVEGTGTVFAPNAIVATGINSLSKAVSSVPLDAYSRVALNGLDETGYLNGSFVNTQPTSNRVHRSNHDFSDLDRGTRGFAEVEAYWAIDSAQRYIRSFGITNAAGYSIGVNVHAFADDNSFYSSFGDGRGQISFGDGGVPDAEDADIVWHEYGHAILDHQRPSINQNFDGMGEGFSDYWAATMAARQPSADHAQYDPAVGEWDATAYNPGNPPYLRKVDTAAHYPEGRSGDPHVTGMIWSAALWEINRVIGQRLADEIFLEGNFLLPSNPTLPQAAQCYLQAELSVTGGAYQEAMQAVFTSRGLVGGAVPSISLMAPVGGENWVIGTDQAVLWNSAALSGNVRVRLSRDGGQTFSTIISSAANTGSAAWVVAGPATDKAIIRVQSTTDGTVLDQSRLGFAIAAPPPPKLQVLSANGGEYWKLGTVQSVKWTSEAVSGTVQIYLSRNGGTTYSLILNNVPNTGSAQWTVSGLSSSRCKVKVISSGSGEAADTTDGTFSIGQ